MGNKLNLLLFAVLGLASRAMANDGYAAIAAGGIEFRKSEDIQIKSEILSISSKKVTVRYEFVNDSKNAIDAVLAFPMPDITCGAWGKNKGIDDFTVTVNGKSVKPTKELKAFNLVDAEDPSKKGEKELTKEVQQAGLPLDCREVNKDKKLFAKARKAKLAEDYQGSDPENILYTTRITYWWKQKFEPGKTLDIEHSYTPLAGAGASGLPEGYLGPVLHWDSPINVRNLMGKDAFSYKRSDISFYSVVEYILTTAQTWKGPIKQFTLLLKRDDPGLHVGSTLGPLTKTDDQTLKFEAQDFTPKKDLTVIFQQRSESQGN
jgi:hypothetical protein